MEHATTTIRTSLQRIPAAAANTSTLTYIELSDKAFTDSRQRLISYLVKLNQALDRDLTDLSQALLTRFCESLVDYLSAGHFNLFQRVVLAPDEYAAIESTTALAMTFNDRFAGRVDIDTAQVKGALEHLAQILGTRFELEDDSLLADRCRRH
jgi:regulator of sigma D